MKVGKDCAASKTLTEMPSMVAGKIVMEMPSVCGSFSPACVGWVSSPGCVASCVKVGS